jgi:hypothetical protein
MYIANSQLTFDHIIAQDYIRFGCIFLNKVLWSVTTHETRWTSSQNPKYGEPTTQVFFMVEILDGLQIICGEYHNIRQC